MYALSDLGKQSFQRNYQYTTITMGDVTITNEDILDGGLVINRSSQTGNTLEIGNVIAAELVMQLYNADGRFDNVVFEGKTLYVVIQSTDMVDEYTLPMGYFIVDSVAKTRGKIRITALDRMAAFDRVITTMSQGMTLPQVVLWAATACGVPTNLTESDFASFPNKSLEVSSVTTGDTSHTYREVLSWACECMGINAYCDWLGRLCVAWYADTGVALTTANRTDSELGEDAITVTGVKIGDTQYGSDGYVIQISDNDFATENSATVGAALNSYLNGFSYTMFRANVLPMPWIWPMDGGTYDDGAGNVTDIIVTDSTFKLNGFGVLEGKGESKTKVSSASANPLTKRESALIKQLQSASLADTTYRVQQLVAMNSLAAYSMGLYPYTVTGTDGSTTFYWMDQPTLADSTTVYKMNAGGFFVSNDGGSTWTSGLDANGNLNVHILTADAIVTGTLDASRVTISNLVVSLLRSYADNNKTMLESAAGYYDIRHWDDDNSRWEQRVGIFRDTKDEAGAIRLSSGDVNQNGTPISGGTWQISQYDHDSASIGYTALTDQGYIDLSSYQGTVRTGTFIGYDHVEGHGGVYIGDGNKDGGIKIGRQLADGSFATRTLYPDTILDPNGQEVVTFTQQLGTYQTGGTQLNSTKLSTVGNSITYDLKGYRAAWVFVNPTGVSGRGHFEILPTYNFTGYARIFSGTDYLQIRAELNGTVVTLTLAEKSQTNGYLQYVYGI